MAAGTLAGIAMLVLGESHLSLPGYLMNPLYEELTTQGASVHAIGACGATAGDWLKKVEVPCGADRFKGDTVFKGRAATTSPIKELIAQDKPNLVVIILGDTMASYDNETFPRAWGWQGITGLTKEIAATQTPCVWVGPAWGTPGGKYFKNDKRVEFMAGFLEKNVAPCVFIDSLKFSKPGQWATVDGQHFNLAGYQAWSANITKALAALPVVQGLKK